MVTRVVWLALASCASSPPTVAIPPASSTTSATEARTFYRGGVATNGAYDGSQCVGTPSDDTACKAKGTYCSLQQMPEVGPCSGAERPVMLPRVPRGPEPCVCSCSPEYKQAMDRVRACSMVP